ncbi:MAG: TonB-dependent receptor, partial [Bacteroidota bacterium]|nr:TonB-dependent receptor [Bacteroidota bacterium]
AWHSEDDTAKVLVEVLTDTGIVIQKRIEVNPGAAVTYTLPAGKYTLKLSCPQYDTVSVPFIGTDNMVIGVTLSRTDDRITVITGASLSRKLEDLPGKTYMTIGEVQRIPSLLGEADALKAVQYMPGVQSGGEGSSGFFVRGGSHDQNLYLLDNIPLYNVTHMLGVLGVFNPDAVSGVNIYTGGYPASYGGRLSSYIDVWGKGVPQKATYSGGIGIIASRLTFETPLQSKNNGLMPNSSLLLSGRRTYLDVFTRPINALKRNSPGYSPIPTYYFSDFNGRLNFGNDRKQLSISAYHGDDYLKYNDNGLDYLNYWGNTGIGATFFIFSKDLNSLFKTTVFHTRYRYGIESLTEDYSLALTSRISDAGIKTALRHTFNDHVTLETGLFYTLHHFSPQSVTTVIDVLDIDYKTGSRLRSHEWGAYTHADWTPAKNLTAMAGVRMANYTAGSKTWVRAEPRLSLTYLPVKLLALKGSYARVNQFMHLISNGMASFPTDIWYPATAGLAPQQADVVSAGFSLLIFKKKALFTYQSYYKWIRNAVEYAEGADILFQSDFESQMVTGRGWAYGHEFGVEKSEGRFTGAVAYTLSWAKRQFDAKNFGRSYFAGFDRRHNISARSHYIISPRAELSLSWIFSSGNPTTLPVGRMGFNNILPWTGGTIPIYEEKNNFRLPSFHHLDASFTWKFKPKRGESSLSVGAYNLYNHKNTYFIHLKTIRNSSGETVRYQPQR